MLTIPYAFAGMGLHTPAIELDLDFQAVVAYLNAGGAVTADTLAHRPAPGNAGAIYVTTDENYLIYVDDGAAWQRVSALHGFDRYAGAGSPASAAAGFVNTGIDGATLARLLVTDQAGQLTPPVSSGLLFSFAGNPVKDINTTNVFTSIFPSSAPSIAANTFTAVRRLHLHFAFDFLNNTGAAQGLNFQVNLGGSSGLNTTLGTNWTSSATRRALYLDVLVAMLNATNAEAMFSVLTFGKDVGVSGAPVVVGFDNGGTTLANYVALHNALAVDLTAAQTLDVLIKPSASNANLSARFLSGWGAVSR